MKLSRRLLSLVLVAAILVSAIPNVFAANPRLSRGFTPSEQLNAILGAYPSKTVTDAKPLYDADETVIAYCVELSGGGFAVQDTNGDVM